MDLLYNYALRMTNDAQDADGDETDARDHLPPLRGNQTEQKDDAHQLRNAQCNVQFSISFASCHSGFELLLSFLTQRKPCRYCASSPA